MFLSGVDLGPLAAPVQLCQAMFHAEHLVTELASHPQMFYLRFALGIRIVASFLVRLELLKECQLVYLLLRLFLFRLFFLRLWLLHRRGFGIYLGDF